MSGIHLHDGSDGPVLLIVGTTATVVLDASVGGPLRDEVQRAIEEPEPAVAFLSALTAGGVRDLPRFAYVGREGTTARILLRGAIDAIERRADGTEAVHKAGSVSTWAEILRDGCCDISLRIPGGGVCVVVAFTPPPAAKPGIAAVADEEGTDGPWVDDGAGHGARGVEDGTAELSGPPVVGGSRVDETMLPADLGELGATVADAPGEPEAPTGVTPRSDQGPGDEVDLSHLFETRHVGVEAAAVRSDDLPLGTAPHPEMSAHDAGALASAGASGTSPTALPPPSGPAVSLPPPPAVSDGTPPAAAPVVQMPPPTGPAVAAPPPPGLIAGVPGIRGDHAPDREAAPPTPSPGATDPPGGDHDGLTISPAQLAALRSGTASTAMPSAARAAGPQLQAVTCPTGHLNPPQADQCRSCGSAIADRTIRVVARPILGHLRFDGGMVADIDRPMLIGRKPTVDGLVPGVEVPALVVLPDPDGSLSRVHAEIRLEGWEVLVVDRDSTNGTRVEVPGQLPVLLRPHEPFLVSPGTTITLADVVTCTYQPGPR